MDSEIFTFYASPTDGAKPNKEIAFTGTIVTMMGPSVVSESFAAKFPIETIDREDRRPIKTELCDIRSNGRIEISFRVEHRKGRYRTGFLILPDEKVKPGKLAWLDGEAPTTECDAMIGRQVAKHIGLLNPARGRARLVFDGDVERITLCSEIVDSLKRWLSSMLSKWH